MKEESLYKIISIILIPFAAILALLSMLLLLMVIVNPIALLIVLILICVLLYSFFSMKFFWSNILKNKTAVSKLRNRIRWTGFITMIFLFNAIFSCVASITDKGAVMQASHKAYEMMEPQLQEAAKSNPEIASFTEVSLYHAYNTVIIIVFIYCLILLLHLLMSFKFLVKYRYLFLDNDSGNMG